tara:strand:- start:122 stop:598 length:477 start_codon:yes stop_codon:yes gene_type:complete
MVKTTLIALSLFTTQFIFSQETLSTSGVNASGEKGIVSYTVGQMVYTTYSNDTGSLLQGVQQNIELFTLTNPELTSLTLKAITYPNPASDYIILGLENIQLTDLNYLLYDILGKRLASGKVTQANTQITIKRFPIGTYLLKVIQNNKELKVFKIIKFK